jgi:DNA-binding GntR family transcriptional regulator
VSQRRAPQDISWALGLAPGTQVRVIRCLWTSAGVPAAISTAYLPDPPAAPQQRPGALSDAQAADTDWVPTFDALLSAPPPGEQDGPDGADTITAAGRPAALHVEMRPPQPSVARGLHLGPGQPAITVTIRFDDSSTPVALTVVMLRPDLFKVSVETAPPRVT